MAYKYIRLPLHSGFCGKEIQKYGLVDKHSIHQPGPQPAPNASVPASDGTHRQEEQRMALHKAWAAGQGGKGWICGSMNMFLAGFKGER